MLKYMMISLVAFVLSLSITTQSYACDLCGSEETSLVNEVESIVGQIERVNQHYAALKNAAPSAKEVAELDAIHQKKKQALIDIAVGKVNQIQ